MIIELRAPDRLSPEDASAAQALLRGGSPLGRPVPEKLRMLALMREVGSIQGVAGLKLAEAERCSRLAERSGHPEVAVLRHEIAGIFVAPPLRRQGHATRLLAALLSWTPEAAFATLPLQEATLARILTRLGLRRVGRPWQPQRPQAGVGLWIMPGWRADREIAPPSAPSSAGGTRAPTALLFGLNSEGWSALRLTAPLKRAGFRVAIAAPLKSLALFSRQADHLAALPRRPDGEMLLSGLSRSIAAFDPDCLVPVDNRAATFVSQFLLADRRAPAAMAALLERSLGRLESYPERLQKDRTLALSRSLGVRTPAGAAAGTLAEVRSLARELGFPVVLKRSIGGGGSGVVICRDADELEVCLDLLADPAWQGGGRGPAQPPPWHPENLPIEVQHYVEGQPAMCCAVAQEGRVTAALCALAERTSGPVAPSSVVRLLHHPGMVESTCRMVAAFGASGFISFDFMIERATGLPWLIECNPRPIAIAHLGARVGVDLVAAYRRAIEGASPTPLATALGEATVAKFPKEMLRDPDSPFLTPERHDIPREEPAALRACLARRGLSLLPTASREPEAAL